MTSLGDALTRAGLIPRDYALGAATMQFRKLGGTKERAVEIMQLAFAAERMRGEGHIADASDGHIGFARSRQPDHGGKDHTTVVRKDQSSGVLPVREPSALQRAAAVSVSKLITITVFDRYKTNSNRPWGDVGAHELESMGRDGTVARMIKDALGPLSNKQRFKTIRELMTPERFEEIWTLAREKQDVA
jgi:hypothetical protein